MKWHRAYNLLMPIAIIIGCIAAGAIEGTYRANKAIAIHPQDFDNPEQFRAEFLSRIITGNLIRGIPFALITFFALRPFNKKQNNRPQNNRLQAIDAKASQPEP